ncbi:hypothetical protein BpHYR1_053842 [Brachionus plicatilis]|uniref:HTH psq-type domain-containing protein n=1 Tax=Brachionus plicatilis TaxID=10195 RepID=A0A3M7PU52_BRAPC|nr:hypothetical protein BpHYR1_053842 [Brachionus plicatilis]
MNEKQVCKKRKFISLEVKIDIIKKHTEQKITTSKLAKEYNFNASTISTILSSKAKILEHYEKNSAGPEKKRINKQMIILISHLLPHLIIESNHLLPIFFKKINYLFYFAFFGCSVMPKKVGFCSSGTSSCSILIFSLYFGTDKSINSVRQAINEMSIGGGQGMVRCTCKSQCIANRCSCRKSNLLFNYEKKTIKNMYNLILSLLSQ